jgi:RNA recognition motif-containing protein
MSKLFIGGLSWNTDDQLLRSEFEKYGAVEDCIVIRDRETGRSRGFGFVTYANDEEASAAIDAMNNQELDGRTIRVDRASERGQSDRGSFRPRGGDRYNSGGDRGYNNYRSGDRNDGGRRY